MTKADIRAAVKEAVAETHRDTLKDLVEAQLPLALGEVLGPEIHKAISVRIRRWRLLAMVGYLVMFLGLGYVVHDNRERSTAGRGVLCEIITGGDATLYAYQREKTITRAQLRRALKQSADYREKLGPAPACVSTLTPAPQRLPPAAPKP